MSAEKVDTTSQKKTAALGVGARDGGKDVITESARKSTLSKQCRTEPRLTSLSPIWSDDRKHLQGWEVRA